MKEIYIGDKKVEIYPFEVSVGIAIYLKTINIKCDDIVMTREDVDIISDFEKQNCDIPKNVKHIDDYVFKSRDDIKRVRIPSTVISIGKQCFKNSNIIVYNHSKVSYDE